MRLRWQFGIIAGIFLAIFCLYPQFKMLYLRGDAWNGHYAYNDIDEVAYASYVRALIDGRPRKNDPYSGRDDSPATPQAESLFSIQFAAPYTIAIPARLLGIGTPWAMTIAGAIAGFLAALAAFWLIARMTGSSWYGMAGSIAVFAGGALAAGEGAILEILFDGFSYPYFPGFRRYIPALAMSAVFVFFGAIWKVLANDPRGEGEQGSHSSDLRSRILDLRSLFAVVAVLAFAYTVFSYFYIWTTAAAWFGCLFIVWLMERPDGWRRDLKIFAALGTAFAAVLVPYAYLLSQRSETLEHVQLLVYTRAPDLFRMPEYIGFAVLLILIAGLATRRIEMKERSTLFTLSLALTPFIIFNQQILTGRSLQPIHYQVFIGNYVAGLALVLAIGLVAKPWLKKGGTLAKAACSAAAVAAVVWGFVECHYTVRVLDDANVERDLALPVARRLEELARNEPDPHRTTVLAFDMIQADDLPSVAPQNILWARHQHVFAGLSWDESKERYYQYLYYSNIDHNGLDWLLKNDFVSQIALFGWGRHTDRLSFDSKPLTYREIGEEVARYAEYRENFSRQEAAEPMLTYVVVNNEANTDLSLLDQWYRREAGEVIGKFTIYPVRLR
ncbi:MAG: A24 family peptidase [Pyrinomonadaceae bacterium]